MRHSVETLLNLEVVWHHGWVVRTILLNNAKSNLIKVSVTLHLLY